MKPNFALSLSFEGIQLLHRSAGGWREVGEVSVSSDDLAGELAVLRKTAASLEPRGVRTKLLIPASQIKYLTIDTIGLSDAARRKEAEAALEAATPYTAAELAYDICLDGAKTHVAAVARETLAEAEAFATEHRFHPVSFVAVPDEEPYLGEPFFGTTHCADDLLDAGETVEPDGIAVVVIGAVAPEALNPQKNAAGAEISNDTAGSDTPVAAPAKATKPEPAAQPTPEETAAVALQKTPDPSPQQAASADASERASSAGDTSTANAAPAKTGAVQSNPAASKPAQASAPAPAIKAAPAPAKAAAPDAPTPSAQVKPADDAPKPPRQAPEPRPFKAATPLPDDDMPTTPKLTGFASRRSAPAAGAATAKPVGGATRIAVPTPNPSASAPAATPMSADSASAPTERKAAGAGRTLGGTIGGFLSRRKPRIGAAEPVPAPVSSAPAPSTEAERMTVFGARSEQVGGKPRFLGLILTVILLVFLAGVAAWAAVFLDEGLAGFIRKDGGRAAASAPENQIDPEIIRTTEGAEPDDTNSTDDVQVAALDPVLSAEDAAVVDAAQDPRPQPQVPVITEAEAAARYAVTGIWPLSPQTLPEAPETKAVPVFRSGIDPVSSASDAFALPAPQQFDTDVQLAAVASPAPFGQRSVLGGGGLITPTEDGIVTPDGYTLYAASPPLKPPATLARFVAEPTVSAPAATSALAAFRPEDRPDGLAERTERAQLGGVTRGELAAFRPALRPSSLQDRAKEAEEEAARAAEAEEALIEAAAQSAAAAAAAALLVPTPAAAAPAPAIVDATRFATAQSKRPDTRPRNFARIVNRAQRVAPQAETRVAAAASVAPRTVTPSLPSKASVARSATVKNAINLRRVNLIGVYGKSSNRRALVRLGNGRYQKVKVGDRIDGGRVAAIGTSELRYSKGGRNVILKMP